MRTKSIINDKGERVSVPMTAEEEIEMDRTAEEMLAVAKLKEERLKKRQSALAKLAALGLTEDEIAAL